MNRIFVLRGDLVVNAVIVEPDCGWVAPPPEPELIIEDNVQNIQ